MILNHENEIKNVNSQTFPNSVIYINYEFLMNMHNYSLTIIYWFDLIHLLLHFQTYI